MPIEPTSLSGRWIVLPPASPSKGAFVEVPADPTTEPAGATLFRRQKEPLQLLVGDWSWNDDAGRGEFSLDDGHHPTESAWLVQVGADQVVGALTKGSPLVHAYRASAPPAGLEGEWSVAALGGAPIRLANAWSLEADPDGGPGTLTIARRHKSVAFRVVAMPASDDGHLLLAVDLKGSVLQLQLWKVPGGYLVTERDSGLTYILYQGDPPAGWPAPPPLPEAGDDAPPTS